MVKKLVSGPILSPLAQIWAPKFFSWTLLLLDVKHCCKLSLYAFSRKTNELNLRKWQKSSFGPNFDLFGLNLGHQFFFKSLALSVFRYYGQLSSFGISEKTNNPILRKLSDGRTNGRTDGRTDGREWFYRTLSD